MNAERDIVRDGVGGRDLQPIPHVVAWNLTKRCNLACGHCYIAAGRWVGTEGELETSSCVRVIEELLQVNPAPMLILSGGEPLLRDDLEVLAYRASRGGATVVVGTNGTLLGSARVASLKDAGVQGIAVSIDSLRPSYHERFRHGDGALADTMAAVERVAASSLDFIVQMSVTRGNHHELESMAAWAASRGAVSFNVYFLVATGRGAAMPGLAPEDNEEVLARIVALERQYRGSMMVRAKCQPQIMRHVHAQAAAGVDEANPLLHYSTRCPCGVQYCRITPEGCVTPCPYLPVVAGDLRQQAFADIWHHAAVFRDMRGGNVAGKCGRCRFREVCGGCRARAYATGGDLLGADDGCIYAPVGQEPVVATKPAVYGQALAKTTLPWTVEARERLGRIPSFVRGVVSQRIEAYAREHGHRVVDVALMGQVRGQGPGDLSQRLPFFSRRLFSRRAAKDPHQG